MIPPTYDAYRAVAGLRLGLPGDEDDLLSKLGAAGVLTVETVDVLRRMRGLRNILVHDYGRVNDRLVYETLTQRLGDFEAFKREAPTALARGR